MNNTLDSGTLTECVALAEKYKAIKAENDVLRAEIDDCKRNIETQLGELATLVKLLEARNHQILLAISACLSLEGKMHAMTESFSWKVARSIRRLEKIFTRPKASLNASYFIRTLIEQSSYFDSEWYVTHHPEVLESGVDPLQYFITHGLAKWHDPGPKFSCDKYIDKYPDVAISGMPPFLHFVRHGVSEGRDSA